MKKETRRYILKNVVSIKGMLLNALLYWPRACVLDFSLCCT